MSWQTIAGVLFVIVVLRTLDSVVFDGFAFLGKNNEDIQVGSRRLVNAKIVEKHLDINPRKALKDRACEELALNETKRETCVRWFSLSLVIPGSLEAGYNESCDTTSEHFDIDNRMENGPYTWFSPVSFVRIMWYLLKLILVFIAAPRFPINDVLNWTFYHHMKLDGETDEEKKEAFEKKVAGVELTEKEFIAALHQFKHSDIQLMTKENARKLFTWIMSEGTLEDVHDSPTASAKDDVGVMSSLLGFAPNSNREVLSKKMGFDKFNKIKVRSPNDVFYEGEDGKRKNINDTEAKKALYALGAGCLKRGVTFREWHWAALLVAAGKCHDCGFDRHVTLQDLLYNSQNPDDALGQKQNLGKFLPKSDAEHLDRDVVNAYFNEFLNQSPTEDFMGVSWSLPWSNRVQVVIFLGQSFQGVFELFEMVCIMRPHAAIFFTDIRWTVLAYRAAIFIPTVYQCARLTLIIRKLFLLITPAHLPYDEELMYFQESLHEMGPFFVLIKVMIFFFLVMLIPLGPRLAPMVLPAVAYMLVRRHAFRLAKWSKWLSSAILFVVVSSMFALQEILARMVEEFVYARMGMQRPYLCPLSKIEILNDSWLTWGNPNSLASYINVTIAGIFAMLIMGFLFVKFAVAFAPGVTGLSKKAIYHTWLYRSRRYLEAIEGNGCVDKYVKIIGDQKIFESRKSSRNREVRQPVR